MTVDLDPIIVVIRYHCWWPGSDDPYYNYNITENRARINYYGADYAPHLWIDGNIDAGSNSGSWETRFINEADVWSPLVMDITGTFDSDNRAGEFTVSVFAELDPGASNLKLRMAIIENRISWRAPNGTSIHNQTFRDMVPSAQGVGFTLEEGETFEHTESFETPSPLIPENCQIVAFVQSDLNRRIVQAAKVYVPDLTPTGVDDGFEMPESFTLSQNYPNPFNAKTSIEFDTPGGLSQLEVFDLTGAHVATLVDGELEAGHYSVVWDGSNNSGSVVASGVYFYRLNTLDGQQIRRMTLLK